MRGLCWIVGIVVVAVGLFLVSPPRWGEAPVRGTGGTVATSQARSLMVRLAKAGQSMRERVPVSERATNSFDAP